MAITQALEKAQARVTDVSLEAAEEEGARARAAQVWQMIGGAKFARGLSGWLHSQHLLTFNQILEDKSYLDAGFKSFKELMDSPDSPMSYKTFNDQWNLLKAEGAPAYDALNTAAIPFYKRKLLTDGTVKIEGDEIIAGDLRASLTDRKSVINIFQSLAAKTEAQSKKLEKGAVDLDKQKKKYEALKKNPGSVDLALKQGPGEALMTLLGFYATFREQVELLSDADREKLRNPAMGLISNQHEMLAHALGVANTKKRPAKAKADALAALNTEFGLSITEADLEAMDDEE